MIYALSQTLLIIISFKIVVAKEDSLELRQLSTGTILGRKLLTAQNTTALLFLGVPYGEAPKGNLRYRAPVPKKAWKEVLNVQNYKAACMQNTSGGGAILFPADMLSEDCLLMNVFTSENCLRQTKRCSVIYYIHGGGYNYDAPIMFDAEFLANNFASKDVLLVTVTYRLGSFGFFNLGSMTNAEKNVGMLGR
jgi:carboxylesterase type B